MALTKAQLESFSEVKTLSVGKLWCIAKAAYACYRDVKGAADDVDKVTAAAAKFIKNLEVCLKAK